MSNYKIARLETELQRLKQHSKTRDDRETRTFAPMRYDDGGRAFYCADNQIWFGDNGRHLEWAAKNRYQVIVVDHKDPEWIYFWLEAHTDWRCDDALDAFDKFLKPHSEGVTLTTQDLVEWAMNDAIQYVDNMLRKRWEYSLSEWIAVNYPETGVHRSLHTLPAVIPQIW